MKESYRVLRYMVRMQLVNQICIKRWVQLLEWFVRFKFILLKKIIKRVLKIYILLMIFTTKSENIQKVCLQWRYGAMSVVNFKDTEWKKRVDQKKCGNICILPIFPSMAYYAQNIILFSHFGNFYLIHPNIFRYRKHIKHELKR